MWGRGGDKSPNWQGGRRHRSDGYVQIYQSEHPSRVGKYIFEHRLVMEEHLRRYLESWEIVHHINGIRDDNRIENLELLPRQGEHHLITMDTNARVQEAEAEALKYERAFYRAVAMWLREREGQLLSITT